MTGRREIISGLACLGAAAAAYGLRPRRRLSELAGAHLDLLPPRQVLDWTASEVTDLVEFRQSEAGLSAKLYDSLVERLYSRPQGGPQIMMLLAYGDSETNELQLHRPETCYPAFGFRITHAQADLLRLAPAVDLPIRRLVAVAPGRQENIVYWSRLGRYFPTDGREQRIDRLKTSMNGFVADGILARFSSIGTDSAADFAAIEDFISAFLRALPPTRLPAFLGAERSAKLGWK